MDVFDEAERVGGERDVEARVVQRGEVLGVCLMEADRHLFRSRESAGAIELRSGEVDRRDVGAHLREMDRGLTAATCNFQDDLVRDGFSKDLQFALWRHRWPPEDVAFELGVVAGLVLLARRVPVVAVGPGEGRVVGHEWQDGRRPLLALQLTPTGRHDHRAHRGAAKGRKRSLSEALGVKP